MDDEGRQATFGADGELSERSPDADDANDFGEPKGANETDGGYSRYVVSSLLQKAVRRSDEEVAAWAAWELARSGFAWNLWDRLHLYVVEDLRAGQDVALLVERYESLATERWEPESWEGRLCAIHAALTCARSRSSREGPNADEHFRKAAEARAERRAAGTDGGGGDGDDGGDGDGGPTFPVDDLEPGGEYDVVFDQHTGVGSRLGRGAEFFKTHGARVGPEGESEQSARWQRENMAAHDAAFSPAQIEHAVSPVDPERRWDEPAFDGEDSGSDGGEPRSGGER